MTTGPLACAATSPMVAPLQTSGIMLTYDKALSSTHTALDRIICPHRLCIVRHSPLPPGNPHPLSRADLQPNADQRVARNGKRRKSHPQPHTHALSLAPGLRLGRRGRRRGLPASGRRPDEHQPDPAPGPRSSPSLVARRKPHRLSIKPRRQLGNLYPRPARRDFDPPHL